MNVTEKRAWSYDYQVNRGASDLSKSSDRAPRVNGRRLKFCPECGGLMAVDHNGFDLFCPVCGLIDETPINEDLKQWIDPIKKKAQTEYEKRINAIIARIDPPKKSCAPHKPTDKKQLEMVMIDRRVENIVRSLQGDDIITDLKLIHGKLPNVLSSYNGRYPPIKNDQLRNSYNRFVKRQDNKIDRFIKLILKNIFDPTQKKIIAARMCEDVEEQMITAKYFPAAFVYDGTHPVREKYNSEIVRRIHDKAQLYYRKKEVGEIIRNSMNPILLTRIYKSNGSFKKILFTLMYNNIYLSGDELDSNFENFFLSEALKHGYLGQIPKCPGTRKECARHKVATMTMFRDRFSGMRGFRSDPFYDWTPYMPQRKEEPKNME